MKILKLLTGSLLALCCAFFVVGCGTPETTITLGSYNEANSTFTANTSNSNYSLEQKGNTLVLKGTIPYSDGTLGIDSGNIVAIKFKPTNNITPDETTSIKTTNNQETNTNGWNSYDKNSLENDGSIIWVTSVSKDNDVQIKIKWNKDFEEITYTLTVDETATLATPA